MSTKESTKRSKKGFAMLAIAGGALSLTIGGVFAANSITINDNQDIEFGQGVADASACDADLTTEIVQTYNPGDNAFYISTITVSGIGDLDCNGKTLHISLVNSGGIACGIDGTTLNWDKFEITDGATVGVNDETSVVIDTDSSCAADGVTRVAITTS